MKVGVYCNIRTSRLSVKALSGVNRGLVIASVEQIQLSDASFRVSQAGRQRVLETGRKNVHASVVGTVEALWGATLRDGLDNETLAGLSIGRPFRPVKGSRVRYNPRETTSFVRVCDGTPVAAARRVHLNRCHIVAAGLS